MDDSILQDQLRYYRERAAEYEQFYTRQGRYDHGPRTNQNFLSDLAVLQQFVASQKGLGDVLEFACGTGYWTQELVKNASSLTAVDGAPEMLAIAKGRTASKQVEWVCADLFSFEPARKFDTIFFGFWLSHVPHARFDAFWRMVREAATPQTSVLFLDSRFEPTSTAKDHVLNDANADRVRRRLNDGREFEIVKIFHKPQELRERLERLGWNFEVHSTPQYFLYGRGSTAH